MNKLKVFNHEMFGEVEVLVIGGKEHFGAVKVAKALGYSNPHDALQRHCKDKGVVKHEVLTSGGKQEMKFIDEGNLYRLITKSKLPSAEKFETWVFDEVLPSIRKHGAYITENTLEKALTSPDFLIQLATNLKQEQDARKALEQEAKVNQPKVLFANAVEVSESSILIGELSKILKQNGISIGQNRLFDWLREKGYLIKKQGEAYNLPTQRAMEAGLFEIKKRVINNPDGSIRTTRTTKVTGKGQIYFVNKFLNSDKEVS